VIGHKRAEPPIEILERMRKPDLADSRPGADERRRAAIAAMSRAIRAEGQRRKFRFSWPVVSAAAVLLLAVGAAGALRFHRVHDSRPVAAVPAAQSSPATAVALRVSSGVVVATRRGEPVVVSAASEEHLAEGDSVRTGPDASATLFLPRGVRVELSRATKASVVSAQELDQKLALDIGETRISVPKPGGPHTFSVTTPDARVVVHGTEFTVHVDEVDGSGKTRTSVSVVRGSVSVINATGERLLSPGQSWSADKSESVADPVAAPATSLQSPPRARFSSAKESPSSLAEQNRLFQAALDARRTGDAAAALKFIDELFARYPDTTLAQEARLARFRALKSLNRNQDAAREARKYLSAHPDAPAADEARRALLESTTEP
jgi:hypothetical protein